jgi:hypothetical protein
MIFKSFPLWILGKTNTDNNFKDLVQSTTQRLWQSAGCKGKAGIGCELSDKHT